MYDTLVEKLIEVDEAVKAGDKEKLNYFHVSAKDLGSKIVFQPKLPEDPAAGELGVPRISVAPTVEGCLIAIGADGSRNDLFVYQVQGSPEVVDPKGVVDARVTGEKWVLEPVSFVKVDTITEEDISEDDWGELEDLGATVMGTSQGLSRQRVLKKALRYLTQYVGREKPEIWESVEATDKEKLDYFFERTNKHIELVQAAAAKIVEAYPEEFVDLTKEVEDHDDSKLKEPEKTPYIDITWRHKLEKEQGKFDPIKGKGYQNPGKLEKKEENEATLHHIKNNSHHPEFWLDDKTKANISSTNRDDSIECVDASRMPDIAIAEMVADWQAMAEELQTNTAREWFNKVKDTRWHFSEYQEELVDRLLKVFEESGTEVKEAKHSRRKCMNCSSVPEVEILWAEGKAHAWLCMKCLKKWAAEGDGWHDVDAAKKIQNGEASKKWRDNTSANIANTMKFLK